MAGGRLALLNDRQQLSFHLFGSVFGKHASLVCKVDNVAAKIDPCIIDERENKLRLGRLVIANEVQNSEPVFGVGVLLVGRINDRGPVAHGSTVSLLSSYSRNSAPPFGTWCSPTSSPTVHFASQACPVRSGDTLLL